MATHWKDKRKKYWKEQDSKGNLSWSGDPERLVRSGGGNDVTIRDLVEDKVHLDICYRSCKEKNNAGYKTNYSLKKEKNNN